jgi:peptide/nickel transport system ATP-binding protein
VTETAIEAPPVGTEPLLAVEDLHVLFHKGSTTVQAVAGISFTMRRGETLGLVGESGCGKSTTGRAIVQVEKPTSGRIRFGDTELTALSRNDLRTLRTQVQMIFQDPISSLNPRRKVTDIVAEPLTIWKIGTKEERRETVRAMLERVGIDPFISGNRRPREFSGGQCQRISIARALVLQPKLLVCDEIVSALDVSVQAQILNILKRLQTEQRLAYLFISHHLSVVRAVSRKVVVMYLGQVVEWAPTEELFSRPLHPYTQALLAAIPVPDPTLHRERIILKGDVPSPAAPPSGCRFHTRCPAVMPICPKVEPRLLEIRPGHFAACHLYPGQRTEAEAAGAAPASAPLPTGPAPEAAPAPAA